MDGSVSEPTVPELLPPTPREGRRVYSSVYKTAWILIGVILIACTIAVLQQAHGIVCMAFGIAGGTWASRSPYRTIVLPKWLDVSLNAALILVLVLLASSGQFTNRLFFWVVLASVLIMRIFVRNHGEVDTAAADDIFCYEYWRKVGRVFRGLSFSIFVLFGLVAGASLSAPIALEHFRWMLGDELGGGAMAAVGVYLLLVAMVGTWASLGGFGTWAGRAGGRTLRFAIQVLGIVLAAMMTLPLAIVATAVLMLWRGMYIEDAKQCIAETPEDTGKANHQAAAPQAQPSPRPLR